MTDYTHLYQEADEYIIFNKEDDVLDDIKVMLPKPPEDKTKIVGYGLHPKEQMFKRTPYPQRLKELEKKSTNLDEIYEKLELYKDDYQEEIAFIEQEWERRTNGYWLYINGKPTFLDGWQYFFLNYWIMDIGFPAYRDRDRRFFIFARYCFTTDEAYYPFKVGESYFSDEKKAIKFAEEKHLELQRGGFITHLGRRTIIGFSYPKLRREGSTYKAECIGYEIVSRRERVKFCIQSMTSGHAFTAFNDKLIKPWKTLPFFFRPNYDGSTSPKERLVFDVPSKRITSTRGSDVNIDTGLQSEIVWATSADGSTLDGDKFLVIHEDEIGKTVEADVNARHKIIKRCLTQGNGSIIVGLNINTSTVGEMTKKGGANFLKLCKQSHYSQRNDLGQTMSGLVNMFIPSYDGLEGFIDIFGQSVIEDPSEEDLWRLPQPPQRSVDGSLIGAKRYLLEQRDKWIDMQEDGTEDDIAEETRLAPLSFSECFITSGSGTGFNIRKLNDRIKALQFDTTLTHRGNFRWLNDVRDSKVIFEPHKEGRWVVSMVLTPEEASQKYKKEVWSDGKLKNVWYPFRSGRFIACGDPYKFTKVEHTRMSKLGGAVFLDRDLSIDYEDKPLDQWETFRFVCTYVNRPKSKPEAMEDMLMMCVYYNALMFPEINVDAIWEYFTTRGYSGYLKFAKNTDGTVKKTPGFNSGEGTKQKIFDFHRDYIENHSHRERHIEILMEQKSIKGVEDMTNWDLFTAAGGCLLGCSQGFEGVKKFEEQQSLTNNIEDYYGKPKRY